MAERTRYAGFACVAIALAAVATQASADSRAPVTFVTTNQNPFIQVFHLPWSSEPVRPVAGEWTLGWTVDVANGSISEELGDRRVVIDGETWRTSLAFSRGLSPRLEAGIIIPLVSHQSGIFDGFIRDWHDSFGLTNSRRDQFRDYTLDYRYTEAGDARVEVVSASSGIGDIRLTTAWRLDAETGGDRHLSLRAGVKLPTGSASRLHGSGSVDLSLQLHAIDERTLSFAGTTLSWMIGAMRLGQGDVLDDLRRDHVAIGSIGIARPVWRNLLLKVQLDAHSPIYDSDLEILGARALQLVVGGAIRLPRGVIDIGLVENVVTDPTPDFGIHFAWHTLL